MSETLMNSLQRSSLLGGGNMLWLESLYESWLVSPDAVAPHWRRYYPDLRGVFQQNRPNPEVQNITIREMPGFC
jgi:2-oxoglutarate dehydrogenase complex dehydrogenase (E1) component-like enzyme